MNGADAIELVEALEKAERHASKGDRIREAKADALLAATKLMRARLQQDDTAKTGLCGACRAKLSAGA